MNCKRYKNTCCIMADIIEDEFNDFACHNCLIDTIIEHDNLLEKGVITH